MIKQLKEKKEKCSKYAMSDKKVNYFSWMLNHLL